MSTTGQTVLIDSISEKEIDSFFEAVKNFTLHSKNIDSPDDLYSLGLSVYSKLHVVETASFFLLNPETFEFEHNATNLEMETEHMKKNFIELIDKGLIGEALQSASYSLYPHELKPEIDEFYITLPLISSSGIIGIVILKSKHLNSFNDKYLWKLLLTYSILFACRVEIYNMEISQKDMQSIMDQKIAAKTIDIVKSKKMLYDKFFELTANLSMAMPHEIRTPLNMILGNSGFLLNHMEQTSREEILEIMQDIYDAGKRMSRLFERYLFFSKLEILVSNPFDITALNQNITQSPKNLISTYVNEYSNVAPRKKDIVLELEDASIAISEEFFNKIIEELLDNSMKYSDSGTKIVVETKKVNDSYLLSITDYGRGMTSGQIEKADAYLQFERKTYEQQGLGLGLAIVKKIIALFDGDFNIESKLQEYTKVYIQLKLAENQLKN